MYTHTWPKSEPVALLWGDRWWVEGRSAAIPFGESSRAAETLLAAFGEDRPRRLRLIYQPASLVAEPVDCPQGPRATLQAVLGEQFPALFSEDRAWGFEPIVGGQGRFATILYHEAEPGLYPLAQALEAAGIEIVGAWPLAPLLNLLPEDWPETGALTVVAAAENQTLVFRHTPDGKREVLSASGAEAATLALETVRGALSRADTALHIAPLDAAGESTLAQLPPLDVPRLHLVSWPRLTQAAGTLSRRQPTQLLPLSALFAPASALMAASIALFLSVLGLAGEYAWREFAGRRQAVAQAAEETALRTQIAERRAAHQEWRALQAATQAGAATAPLFAPWLKSLGQRLPPEVVVTSLRAERTAITVVGGVTRPVTEIAWRAWLGAIAPAGGRWVLAEPVATPTADFRLVMRTRS